MNKIAWIALLLVANVAAFGGAWLAAKHIPYAGDVILAAVFLWMAWNRRPRPLDREERALRDLIAG